MRRRGPVVALRGGVVEVRGVAVASRWKEDAPVGGGWWSMKINNIEVK